MELAAVPVADASVMKIRGSSNLPPEVLAARAVVRMFHRFESAMRDADVSFAQYRILGFLQNGPRRAGELALAAAVKKPTVSALLNSLRERGWIADRTDPVDGRVVKLILTRRGRARLRTFDERLARTLKSYAANADLPALLTALVGLYASLNAATYPREHREEPRLKSASN